MSRFDTLQQKRYLFYFMCTILIEGGLFLLIDFASIPLIFFQAIELCIGLFWYYHIIQRSGLFRTIFGRLLFIGAAVLMVGALAKLEHWWIASYLLIGGLLVLGLIYLLRFIFKPPVKLLDWVKLLFLELTLFVALARLEHYSIEPYEIIRMVLFFTMIFLFAIEEPTSQRKGYDFRTM